MPSTSSPHKRGLVPSSGSAAERSLRARIAANARWSREDPGPQMQRARARFDEQFIDEVDPNRTLPPAERERRAENARRAYFQRLALASSRARRRRAAADATPQDAA